MATARVMLLAFVALFVFAQAHRAQAQGAPSQPLQSPIAPSEAMAPFPNNDDLSYIRDLRAVQSIGSPVTSLSSTATDLDPDEVQAALARSSGIGVLEDDITPVQLFGLFPTSCTLQIQGNGETISSASMNCTGPNTPVRVTVSDDLAPFAEAFQGVVVDGTNVRNEADLQFSDAQNITLLNSQVDGLGAGGVGINNSRMQIVGGSYTNGSGALSLTGKSSVLIDSVQLADNSAISGSALQVQDSQVIVTHSSFFRNDVKSSQGGAISQTNSSVYIKGSALFGNRASRGAAIYVNGGVLALRESQFVANTAISAGGSIYSDAAALDIFNSTFTKNAAGSQGGAIALDNCNCTLVESVLDQNTAQRQGGAFFSANSTGSMQSCTLSNNAASSGGAMLQFNSTGDITLSLFGNNKATQSGGAILQTKCTSNIRNSSFTANTAARLGGALSQSNGASSISFTIVQNNTAFDGGGLFRAAMRGDIEQCSFISNSANKNGGAIYDTNARGNVRRTLFRDNKATQGSAILLNSSTPEVTGSLFDGSQVAGDAIVANQEAQPAEDTSDDSPSVSG